MCGWPAEADRCLCARDSRIMKASAAQLAESDSFYGVCSTGRSDAARSPLVTPAERFYGPQIETSIVCSTRGRGNIEGMCCLTEEINICSFMCVNKEMCSASNGGSRESRQFFGLRKWHNHCKSKAITLEILSICTILFLWPRECKH